MPVSTSKSRRQLYKHITWELRALSQCSQQPALAQVGSKHTAALRDKQPVLGGGNGLSNLPPLLELLCPAEPG